MASSAATLAAVLVIGLIVGAGGGYYAGMSGSGGSTTVTTTRTAAAATITATATTTVTAKAGPPTGGPVTLNLCVFGGPFTNFFSEKNPVMAQFEQENNVVLKFDFQFLCGAKLQASASSPIYDMAMVDDVSASSPEVTKLLLKINSSVVPNLAKVNPQFVYDGYGVALLPSMIGIAYNTNYVTGSSVPTSWGSLWDSQFKGKVGIILPPHTIGLSLIIEAAYKGGGSITNIAPAFDQLKLLKPNVGIAATSAFSLDQSLIKGDVWVSTMSYGDYLGLKDSGAPIGWVKTGHFYTLAGLTSAVAGRPAANTQMTMKFIDYLISPTVQANMATYSYYVPANPAATLTPHLASLGMDPNFFKDVTEEDAAYVGQHTSEWLNQFNQVWGG